MKPICRLYVDVPLASGGAVVLPDAQAHYVLHTLRAKEGQSLSLFNGKDGEWSAKLSAVSKREVRAQVDAQTRVQTASPEVQLLFAPVKNEKLDFLVMRATELGVSSIQPVITARTIVSRINTERMERNLIEAAEQCERLDVPQLLPAGSLDKALAGLKGRLLIHADESGAGKTVRETLPSLPKQPVSVLIGPEGGFTNEERTLICTLPNVLGLSLGPRILRAETAVIAALANVQAWLGDWDVKPRFE
jgi:16S rRNA (uracil1498-N3)-methyltransferase